VKLGDSKPGDDETKAWLRAYELELEDEALRRFPEIRKLGTFGDPAFEEALERAVDLIDGEDGSTSTAAVKLEHDLALLELNGGPDDCGEASGDVTAPREDGRESCGGRR
jgi:hypothetical protein